jgi:hypothetical protein
MQPEDGRFRHDLAVRSGVDWNDRAPPSRDARLGDRNGRFGIMTARALLLGAVPHPNIPPPAPPAPPPAPPPDRRLAAPAPWTRSSGRSGFQSEIRYLIPWFETSLGFCGSGRSYVRRGAGPAELKNLRMRSIPSLLLIWSAEFIQDPSTPPTPRSADHPRRVLARRRWEWRTTSVLIPTMAG